MQLSIFHPFLRSYQVSLHDLNHIFNESEEDDNGMPTPPDDHQDDNILDKKVRQNTTGVIETCLPGVVKNQCYY